MAGTGNIYGGVLALPGADFSAVRDGRAGLPYYVDVDLTNARSAKAGTALALSIAGNFFLSDMDPDNQGNAVVRFQDVSQVSSSAAPIYVPIGFMSQTPFTQVLIENAAQPGKRLRIIYGTDVLIQPGGSNQVNVAGTVSVIDGGKAKTLSGVAFLGYGEALSGAGQYAHVQLWNPGANTKKLIVSALRATVSTTAGFINLGVATAILVGASGAARSKYIGGAGTNSTGLIAIENNGLTDRLAGNGPNFDRLYVPVGQQVPYTFKEPLAIPPGYGLTLQAGQSTTLDASFEFSEE